MSIDLPTLFYDQKDIYSDDIENVDVKEVGNGIRFHEVFAPSGTNVNFVEKVGEHDLKIRTYERGVEDETLACGTGTVASALLSSYKNLVKPPVKVETRGGEILKVDFDLSNVMFLTTANRVDKIPGPLRDRMEILEFSGYILKSLHN